MKATLAEPEIVRRKGKRVSLISPVRNYERMLEPMADMADMTGLGRMHQKPVEHRPVDDYLAEHDRK